MRAVHSDMLHLFRHCQELVKFGSGRGQREAYVTFADLLMVFAKQLRKIPHLASLVYIPDPTLQQTLQVLVYTMYMYLSCSMFMFMYTLVWFVHCIHKHNLHYLLYSNRMKQERIIERERRVSHSVYALYSIPGNGSRPLVGVSTSAKPQARACLKPQARV